MNAMLLTLLIAASVGSSAPPEKTGHTAAVPAVFEAHFGWSPPKMLPNEEDPENKIYVPPHLDVMFKADKNMDRDRSRLVVDGLDLTEYLFSAASGPVDSPLRNMSIEMAQGEAEIELIVYDKTEKEPVYTEKFFLVMAKPKLIEGPPGSRAGSIRVFKRDDIPKDVLKDAPPQYRQ
ncbi:MAG: hypothetical protein KY410_10695 [Proteobacteria bacterium]|nr:hypothetical protein [Pseudomonadota bacterium]